MRLLFGAWDIVICLVLCLIFAVPILLVWRSWKKEEQQMLEEEAEIERIRPFMDYVILTVVQEFFPNGTTYQLLRPYGPVTMSLWVSEETVRVRWIAAPATRSLTRSMMNCPQASQTILTL